MQQTYEQRKNALINEFAKIRKRGSVALGKSTTNEFRFREKRQRQRLNVRQMNHVLSVNSETQTAEVEGMTRYDNLVATTMKQLVVPAVTPELKSITVGGATSGIGIESSCFRYGFVHETMKELDVLTGKGEVLTCSPTKNSDLFYAIPNSYGTLGYVLRAAVHLHPAKPFVETQRMRFSDYDEYVKAIAQEAANAKHSGEWDFIDGLIFSPSEMYLNWAKFVDEIPQRFELGDYTKEVFYKSVREKIRDFTTTENYLFRYDPDYFWTTQSMGLESDPLRSIFRSLGLQRSDVYRKIIGFANRHGITDKLNTLRGEKLETFIQDAEVPAHQAADFLNWFHENITAHRPLTIGPVIPYSPTANFPLFPMDPEEVYMNIGYYATVPSDKPEGYYNKLFEQKLLEIGAKKMMYSSSFYTPDEFWQTFDRQTYEALKARYDPDEVFPGLYEKCVLKE